MKLSSVKTYVLSKSVLYIVLKVGIKAFYFLVYYRVQFFGSKRYRIYLKKQHQYNRAKVLHFYSRKFKSLRPRKLFFAEGCYKGYSFVGNCSLFIKDTFFFRPYLDFSESRLNSNSIKYVSRKDAILIRYTGEVKFSGVCLVLLGDHAGNIYHALYDKLFKLIAHGVVCNFDHILVDEQDTKLELFNVIIEKLNLASKIRIIRSGNLVKTEVAFVLPPIHYTPPSLERKFVIQDYYTLFDKLAMKKVGQWCHVFLNENARNDIFLSNLLFINRNGLRKVNFDRIVQNGDIAISFDNISFATQLDILSRFNLIVCTSGGFLSLAPLFSKNSKILIIYNSPTNFSGWLTLGELFGFNVTECSEQNSTKNAYRRDSQLSSHVIRSIDDFRKRFSIQA